MNSTIVILVAQVIFLLFLVGAAHLFSHKNQRYGTNILISFLTITMVIVQWTSDLGSVTYFLGYPLFISSIVFFPAILLGLFLIFVFDGPVITRQLFYSLILGGVNYMAAVIFLNLLGVLPEYLKLNYTWFSNHFFSTLAVVADFYLVTYFWSLFSKSDKWLFAKIFIIVFGVTYVDTIIFVLGAFWRNSDLYSILKTDLSSRAILSLVIIPFAYLYVVYQKKNNSFHLENRYPWSVTETSSETSLELAEAEKKIAELEKIKSDLTEMSLVANKTTSSVLVTNYVGEITWVNEGFTNMTGFTLNEVVGRTRSGILMGKDTKPSDRDKLYLALTSTEPKILEILNYKKDGSELWLNISITPILDDNKVQKYILVESDITTSKNSKIEIEKANIKLIESNNELTSLNQMMVNRELKMIELKNELEALKSKHLS